MILDKIIHLPRYKHERKQPWRDCWLELVFGRYRHLGIPFDDCSCGKEKGMRRINYANSGYLPPVTENGEIITARLFDFSNVENESIVLSEVR